MIMFIIIIMINMKMIIIIILALTMKLGGEVVLEDEDGAELANVQVEAVELEDAVSEGGEHLEVDPVDEGLRVLDDDAAHEGVAAEHLGVVEVGHGGGEDAHEEGLVLGAVGVVGAVEELRAGGDDVGDEGVLRLGAGVLEGEVGEEKGFVHFDEVADAGANVATGGGGVLCEGRMKGRLIVVVVVIIIFLGWAGALAV